MRELTAEEGRLLEELQGDLPLVSHPFREIGDRCGLSERETIRITDAFLKEGMIREISVLLEGRLIGFRSTLVALCADHDRVGPLAERIGGHPGVSHSYLRDHTFNLWFTLTLPKERDFAAEVGGMLESDRTVEALILPSLRTFKLKVHLRFHDSGVKQGRPDPAPSPGAGVPREEQTGDMAAPLTGFERGLLAALEGTLPVAEQPWGELAAGLGIAEEGFFTAVRDLKRRGVIRRVAAVLRHREAGFKANGMACYRLPERAIARAGVEAASFPSVSHCYQRKTYPRWPYALYTMVHARSREECEGLVHEIARRIRCADFQILYSLKEYRKERIKYFGESK